MHNKIENISLQGVVLKKSQRKTIFHVSRHQRTFLYPVIIAFFLGCAVSWLSLIYCIVGQYIFGPQLDWFQKIIPAILAALTVIMIAVIFWTLRISNRHIGSHERIIKELDEILDGKKDSPLSTRRDDILFTELLKRINSLIDRK